MRDVVRNLAQYFPTAIISGRGREKVETFVQLKELYYAGSHGMDIAGPRDLQSEGQDSSFQPALHFRPLIDEVYSELCSRLESIPGSSVEHNTFCVSAHYRNCPGETWLDVVKAVEETLSSKGEDLKITRGRKVMEIRPKVNWHKGTALNHLLTGTILMVLFLSLGFSSLRCLSHSTWSQESARCGFDLHRRR